MIKNTVRDWRIHGAFAQTPLLAGVLPRSGLHYLTASDVQAKDAVIADLATAAASDIVAYGLSSPDAAGARSSLSGFFGHPVGSATPVAIITSADRADSLSRAVQANALARGVCRPIPIAVLGLAGVGSGHLTGAHARVAELAEWMQAEHGVSLGLVVLDLALPHGELNAFKRPDRAVLVAGDAAPAALDGVIIEVAADRLTVAKPATGEPWAREFALEAVRVEGLDALTVRPGKDVEPSPVWQAAKPAARKVVAPTPELPIVDRYALIVSRGELGTALRNKWLLEGYEIVQSEQAALPKVGEIEGGKREIIVAGEDQLPSELRARATRLEWEAVARGVREDIIVRVAA